MGAGGVNGGYYGGIIEQYGKSVGSSGASKSELRSAGMEASMAYRQAGQMQKTSENIAKIQQAGLMYGLQLDASSIFAMADTNRSGVISDKEANAFMTRLGTMASNGMMGAQTTQNGSASSGSSNVFGVLNTAMGVVGDIVGSGNNENGSGGNMLDKAKDWIGGLFS